LTLPHLSGILKHRQKLERARKVRAEMPFPEKERVIYQINPIEEATCQLRFPPILKIDTELPSEFQDRIRGKYPFYKTQAAVNLPGALSSQWMLPIGPNQNIHEFASKDGNWSLSLTREYLSLTCRRYERWEEFKEHLSEPLSVLDKLYTPAVFVRIGLQYRNVIHRSKLGLTNVGWDRLLQPWIAGAFTRPEVASNIDISVSQWSIRLSNGQSRVQVLHGLSSHVLTQELCYSIDADFYDQQQTEPRHAIERLDFLNNQARLFFRWCITEELHEAMQPRTLSG
jgi:uncharacterized protein (TIGR04255 family)